MINTQSNCELVMTLKSQHWKKSIIIMVKWTNSRTMFLSSSFQFFLFLFFYFNKRTILHKKFSVSVFFNGHCNILLQILNHILIIVFWSQNPLKWNVAFICRGRSDSTVYRIFLTDRQTTNTVCVCLCLSVWVCWGFFVSPRTCVRPIFQHTVLDGLRKELLS